MTAVAKISRALALIALAARAAVAFAQCPNTAPTPVSPTPGQTGVAIRPTLMWTDVGAPKYDIYLAAGTTCPSATTPTASSTSTSFTPQQLQAGTKYAWMVIPVNSSNQHCTQQAMACSLFETAVPATCNLPGSFNLSG